MQKFIIAFANEKIFNVEAKSIIGAKRIANSLRIAIGSDAVYVISRETGEIWKRERFINEDSSGWTKWMRAENHVSAKKEGQANVTKICCN